MSDEIAVPTREEREVIGAVLTYPPALGRVSVEVGLRAEHFYYPQHQRIYAAALRVRANGDPVDELSVCRELADRDSEGLASELASEVAGAANAAHHARTIIRYAGIRARVTGAKEIIRGYASNDLEAVQNGLDLVTLDVELGEEPSTPEEIADDMLRWFEEKPDPAEVMPLPWPKLNPLITGGYRKGQMSVLTGWSGFGKSLALKDMLTEFHRQGRTCLLLTTEMNRREIVCRWLSGVTGIAYGRLMLRKLDKIDMGKIVKALPTLPFHYHDADGWSADRICNAILAKRPDVAAIDPWNLIPHRDQFEAAATAGRLKTLARKADLHVVVVAHLNTSRLKDATKPRPVQRDIRDTGMLFNNAHHVLALQRDQEPNGNEQHTGELFFMKVRDGVKGGCRVELDSNLRFVPLDLDPPAKQDKMPF